MGITLLIFVFWPLLGFILSLKYLDLKNYRLVSLLFFILIGLLFVPDEGADSLEYLHYFEIYSKYSFNDFLNQLFLSFNGKGHKGFEIYMDFVAYISNIFGSYNALYIISSITFYIFWIRIISDIVSEYKSLSNRYNLLLTFIVFFAIYIIVFRAINGRFYLAYWLFIYCFYMYATRNSAKYLIPIVATIFIHQSFILICIITIILLLLKNLSLKKIEIVFYTLIMLGTFYTELGFTFISDNLSILGVPFEDRYAVYASDESLESFTERKRSWFLDLRTPMLYYSMALGVIFLRINNKIKLDQKSVIIYIFILILWSINTFTYTVPAFGIRYRNILMGLMFLFIIRLLFTNRFKSVPVYFYPLIFSFIFYKTISLRMMIEQINIWLLMPFSYFGALSDDPSTIFDFFFK